MATVTKEYKAGLGGIQLGRKKISTGFILGGAAVLAFILVIASQQKSAPAGGGGVGGGSGGGIKPGGGGEPLPTPTVPLYSVINSYVSSCKPYAWNAASDTQWRTIAGLCEGNFKQSQYYKGDGKYIANFSGDIFPSNTMPIIKNRHTPMIDLANWIKSGGIYIDYCSYPFYHSDCQIWIFNNAFSCGNCFADFSHYFGIKELGNTGILGSPNNSDFDAKKTYLNFPYVNSLTLRSSMPSRSIFITSDSLYPNNQVPYIPSKIYSMFALRIGNGFYAYSNVKNNATDYANFLIAVHNHQI
jgi:hypothetical protein